MQNMTQKTRLSAITLAALGVVFGDIGTSPLYALKESFHAAHGLGITPANVLGILSIIFWCLMLIISIKYVAIGRRREPGERHGVALAKGGNVFQFRHDLSPLVIIKNSIQHTAK
jgi:KUP system potassium uptake protein